MLRALRQQTPLLQQLLRPHQAPLCARATSSSSSAAAPPSTGSSASGVIVLPMPALSPTMTSGRVGRWLRAPGEALHQYDVLVEVETESLVEAAYRLDDFAGTVTLLVESQEEATLAAVLVREGEEVAVGAPIALLVEDAADAAASVADAPRLLAGVRNVYDDEGGRLRTLVWQSFLKESKKQDGGGGGGSCGCM